MEIKTARKFKPYRWENGRKDAPERYSAPRVFHHRQATFLPFLSAGQLRNIS